MPVKKSNVASVQANTIFQNISHMAQGVCWVFENCNRHLTFMYMCVCLLLLFYFYMTDMIFMANRSHLKCSGWYIHRFTFFRSISHTLRNDGNLSQHNTEQIHTELNSMQWQIVPRFYWKRTCFCDSLSLFSVASLDGKLLDAITDIPPQPSKKQQERREKWQQQQQTNNDAIPFVFEPATIVLLPTSSFNRH